ncbi:MAG: FecR domain-containing protein [Parafilimonas sp.]
MKYGNAVRLLKKYFSGKASVNEVMKIEKWYAEAEKKQDAETGEPASGEIKERIYQQIVSTINKSKVIPFYKKPFFQVAAAAAIVLLIAGIYVLKVQPAHTKKIIAAKPVYKNDVAPPAKNKAVLTLADGSTIDVESAGNGEFAKQGNTHIVKQADGIIAYKGSNEEKIVYNTLTVPKGSKPLKLKLADGTDVWLNVASSITYPTAFSGNERKVVITGEAYFEVAHNAAMPFIVTQANKDLEVRVLGTHFNVNTYDDESSMNVTLLEGSVNVTSNQNKMLLSPGQQAQASNNGIKKINNANLDEVMAWKNGTFHFEGADIKSIMRQVEKWYNVDVVYNDNINYSFVANISRDVNVSQLLNILQLTDLVHFKIEGNKITVMK